MAASTDQNPANRGIAAWPSERPARMAGQGDPKLALRHGWLRQLRSTWWV